MTNKRKIIVFIFILFISVGLAGFLYIRLKNQKTIYLARAGDVSYEAVGDNLHSECVGMEGYTELRVDVSQTDMKSILGRLVATDFKPTKDLIDYDDYKPKFDKFKILDYEKAGNTGYINLTDPVGFLEGGLSRGVYFQCEFIETVKKNDPSLADVKFRIDGHDVDNYNYYLFQP
jgi:hypothetical protein